jgi:hypothetical protein
MTQGTNDQQLTEERRKEIFFALVDTQDHEIDVANSRSLMAQRFGVSESQIRKIAREGMENKWPPLGVDSEVKVKQEPVLSTASQRQPPPQQEAPFSMRIFKP